MIRLEMKNCSMILTNNNGAIADIPAANNTVLRLNLNKK